MDRPHIIIGDEILSELMKCWYWYGMHHNVETSDIINALDGRIKKVYDTFEEIRDET